MPNQKSKGIANFANYQMSGLFGQAKAQGKDRDSHSGCNAADEFSRLRREQNIDHDRTYSFSG
jgi:hypothetical protein